MATVSAKKARKYAGGREFLSKFAFMFPSVQTDWKQPPWYWLVTMAEGLKRERPGLKIFLGGNSKGPINKKEKLCHIASRSAMVAEGFPLPNLPRSLLEEKG